MAAPPSPRQFDVFLSYNRKDQPAVLALAERLKARGLAVWLDVWELRPGQPWQEALEQAIESIGAAAVLVGEAGIGPWQSREMRGCLNEFVELGKPVIPVLLPACPEAPKLPFFLKQFTWVDLRGDAADGLDRLVWGITGEKPEPAAATPRVDGSPVWSADHHAAVGVGQRVLRAVAAETPTAAPSQPAPPPANPVPAPKPPPRWLLAWAVAAVLGVLAGQGNRAM